MLAVDAAGNRGDFVYTDGFIAGDGSSEECAMDIYGPQIQVVTQAEQCLGNIVSLECSDDAGCDTIMYGTSMSAGECVPSIDKQSGITVEQNQWLCYYANDTKGNNITGTKKIEFQDGDGDGVADTCDLCKDTNAGAVTDAQGCASKETSETDDSDGDGLPDSWEKLSTAPGCELNHEALDTDGNGVSDTDEDFDMDGLSNLEEFRAGKDPCIDDSYVEPVVDTEYITTTSTSTSEGNPVALGMLLLSLLMMGGSGGFLGYFYTQMPQGRALLGGKPMYKPQTGSSQPKLSGQQKTQVQQVKESKPVHKMSLRDHMKNLEEGFSKRSKKSTRSKLFSSFQPKGVEHLARTVEKDLPAHKMVKEVTQDFDANKAQIKQEVDTNLFNKLDKLSSAHKAGEVNAKDANDVFKKLRKISK